MPSTMLNAKGFEVPGGVKKEYNFVTMAIRNVLLHG